MCYTATALASANPKRIRVTKDWINIKGNGINKGNKKWNRKSREKTVRDTNEKKLPNFLIAERRSQFGYVNFHLSGATNRQTKAKCLVSVARRKNRKLTYALSALLANTANLTINPNEKKKKKIACQIINFSFANYNGVEKSNFRFLSFLCHLLSKRLHTAPVQTAHTNASKRTSTHTRENYIYQNSKKVIIDIVFLSIESIKNNISKSWFICWSN